MKLLLSKYILECYKRGWISTRDGNLSLRESNSNYFYITPGKIKKSEVKPKDILKIRLSDNKIVENESQLTPSGEMMLHTLILKDDLNQDKYVIHCHSPYILAFIGLLKNDRELSEIKTIFPEIPDFIKIGKNVSYIKARTSELGKKVYENIKNNNIVALKRHGIVAIGNSFEDIIEIIEIIEYYCKIALLE